ncbi:hypothetical protein AVEN_172299-1 [Araneus ventricosus]|uniref:Uncharacterized protein n=1 Tax=Araneus ventricosus TaxID=182803 RepID=A0A4Y2E561_ARAVE|nr:hypothetical protein AVEN_172299-1 [Araneus ventricosus]
MGRKRIKTKKKKFSCSGSQFQDSSSSFPFQHSFPFLLGSRDCRESLRPENRFLCLPPYSSPDLLFVFLLLLPPPGALLPHAMSSVVEAVEEAVFPEDPNRERESAFFSAVGNFILLPGFGRKKASS